MKLNTLNFISLMTVLTLGLVAQPELSRADDLDEAPEINTEYASAVQPKMLTDLERPPHEPPIGGAQDPAVPANLETAPEYDNVITGSIAPSSDSGFYLRGAIGGSLDVKSVQTTAGAQSFKSNLGNAYQLSAGVGYALNDILRIEGEIGYLGNMKFDDIAGAEQKFDGAMFSINAFADLGTIVGITPYVGGGMGAVKFNDIDARLRLNAQAGFAYKVSEKVALEFGYEYSKTMGGNLDFNGSSFEQDSFDMHMFKIGTRIKF